jgi:hypothetical protein
VPATAEVDLPGLPPPVEAAAYFAVAGALANAAKHAGARSVHIRAAHSSGTLRIEVTDDGVGGADPSRGAGLRGVERRLGTFDGVLAVSRSSGCTPGSCSPTRPAGSAYGLTASNAAHIGNSCSWGSPEHRRRRGTLARGLEPAEGLTTLSPQVKT